MGNNPDTFNKFKWILLLQPTVPFRKYNSILEVCQKRNSDDYSSIISHRLVDYNHPNRCKKIDSKYVRPYCEAEIQNVSRDQLPKAYYRDGSIYLMKIDTIKGGSIFGDNQGYVINDYAYHVNIDTPLDWVVAEYFYRLATNSNQW